MGLLGVGRSRGLDAVRQLHQIVQAMDLWEEHSEGLKQCGLMHLPEDLRRDLRVTKRVDKSAIRCDVALHNALHVTLCICIFIGT